MLREHVYLYGRCELTFR